MLNLSRRAPAAVVWVFGLSACSGEDEPALARDLTPVTVSEPDEDRSASFLAPEYTEAICQHDWPVLSVEGPVCTAREAFTCQDAWTLQSRLESIVRSCGLSLQQEPLEVSLRGGCVTGMASAASSSAHDLAIRECLLGELGAVQAACAEQPECIRLSGTVVPGS
jgi:hypothetical protein